MLLSYATYLLKEYNRKNIFKLFLLYALQIFNQINPESDVFYFASQSYKNVNVLILKTEKMHFH